MFRHALHRATRPCMCCNRANDDEPSRLPHSTTWIGENAVLGITSSLKKGKSVTYVSGTICHPCVGSRISNESSLPESGVFLEVCAILNSRASRKLGLVFS